VLLAATTGDKFEVAWEDGQNALFRIYTKDLKTEGIRIRRKRQEYPNKRFDDAISEKLAVAREMSAPIAKDA
jgi:hypothetical protein